MRRKAPPTRVGMHYGDIKRNFTKEQLAAIGAVALAWNEVENHLGYAFRNALGLPNSVAKEITKRTSIEKQIEDLKLLASDRTRLPKDLETRAKATLGKIAECKKYRDGIIHSLPFHADKGVGEMIDYQAKSHQVLLTAEALNALYDLLIVLASEAEAMNAVFGTFVQMPVEYENPDRDRAHSEQVVRVWSEKLVQAQKKRQSLPPLPDFPDLPELSRLGG